MVKRSIRMVLVFEYFDNNNENKKKKNIEIVMNFIEFFLFD